MYRLSQRLGDRPAVMDSGGIEQRHARVLPADQQSDLGAAFDNGFGAAAAVIAGRFAATVAAGFAAGFFTGVAADAGLAAITVVSAAV